MRLISTLGSIACAALLAACGGGGSGASGNADVTVGDKGPVVPTSGPDSFLLFPNPQKQADGTLEIDSSAYTTAYYEAIDPNNERTTLASFKSKNGFGSGLGEEASIIIGDQRDLGYGRKMTGRRNPDGSLAFVVENFLVGGYGPYSPFNLEAAINGASQWHLGTNGIEVSVVEPGPANPTPNAIRFVKFYTFDPITGARLTAANLDGRGAKAMPTICVSCHGGRGDALTPPHPTTGKRLFTKLMNSASGARGDLGAQLHPFEPPSFDFSTIAGYSRSEQEAKIKTLNKIVLCGLSLPNGTATPTPYAEDACRRVANPNEYQGEAALHLKQLYGGDGLPLAASTTTDTYMPTSWKINGQQTLFTNTVSQSCRVCHGLRGTGNQSDISFEEYAAFADYSDRIKTHIVDRGNMPLAKLIYDKFWSTPTINGSLSDWLISKGYSDAAQKPGRPVADPGPDRVVKSGTGIPLNAAMSLYSSTWQWTVTSGTATIANATAKEATLNATGGDGVYTVQLVTGNGTTTSAAKTLKIKVDSTLAWDPASINFNDIKTVLQSGGGLCTTCHVTGKDAASANQVPPLFYSDYDRAGTGNANDATNKHWLYTEVRGRVNFTDWSGSALLRKPSGHHHNGGLRVGFDATLPVGDAGRVDYDKFVAWIVRGAPEN